MGALHGLREMEQERRDLRIHCLPCPPALNRHDPSDTFPCYHHFEPRCNAVNLRISVRQGGGRYQACIDLLDASLFLGCHGPGEIVDRIACTDDLAALTHIEGHAESRFAEAEYVGDDPS